MVKTDYIQWPNWKDALIYASIDLRLRDISCRWLLISVVAVGWCRLLLLIVYLIMCLLCWCLVSPVWPLVCRMAMRCSFASRDLPSWRSWWMPTATASLWICLLSRSCLMVAGSVPSRPLMRYVRLPSAIPQPKSPCRFLNLLLSPRFQLEMEDGDEIDAMLHQTGGRRLPPSA